MYISCTNAHFTQNKIGLAAFAITFLWWSNKKNRAEEENKCNKKQRLTIFLPVSVFVTFLKVFHFMCTVIYWWHKAHTYRYISYGMIVGLCDGSLSYFFYLNI